VARRFGWNAVFEVEFEVEVKVEVKVEGDGVAAVEEVVMRSMKFRISTRARRDGEAVGEGLKRCEGRLLRSPALDPVVSSASKTLSLSSLRSWRMRNRFEYEHIV
jgi:hypothetical protein